MLPPGHSFGLVCEKLTSFLLPDEMATGQVWIHPALTEVVEQALLKLVSEFDAWSARGLSSP